MEQEDKQGIFSFWKDSLAGKFVSVTIAVVFVIMVMMAFLNYQSQKDQTISHIKAQSEMLGNFISSIVPYSLLSYDFDALNDYMAEVSQGQDIVYAVILSRDNRALTRHLDRRDPYIVKHLEDVSEIDLPALIEQLRQEPDIIHQSFPIIYENKVLANFNIGISQQRVEELLRKKLYNQILAGVLLTLLLGGLIYILFRIYAVLPIRQLTQGARRIADGQLDKELNVRHRDELGKLSRVFNQMMSRLKQTISEKDQALQTIQDLNQSLEKRVAERTSELEQVNQKLEQLALNDSLTNLPNRFSIQDRLIQSIAEAKRNATSFAVIMLDLDRFKEINDTLGHDCGDQLLIEVGYRLREILRPSDTVGRLGGDEFAILLAETDEMGAKIVARKVQQVLEPSFYLSEMAFTIAGSIGIAIYPKHGNTASSLLKSADVAMYQAKQHKIGYSVYNPGTDSHSPDRLSLMGELRKAIHEDKLELYYQPKLDLLTEKIVGVEALLRWYHVERGYIPPDEFIGLAEQSGLIRSLTYWVINHALQQLDEWHGKGYTIPMSINLSMHNLQDADFASQLGLYLKASHVDNSYIQFEITESAIMSNPDYVMSVLRHLGEHNVSFSIDDFGTGYSSLSMLKKLPVHEIKIDKSFVMDMARDSDDEAIVHSIIDMAKTLGLKVIAEGVENAAVTKMLLQLDCDMIQGYHISRPLPANQLAVILKNMNYSSDVKATNVTKIEKHKRKKHSTDK